MLRAGRKKVPPRPGPVPARKTRRLFFGATYLFDQIASATGLKADLQKCFPDSWAQILSIAYFLILEDNDPLYRFEKFDATHRHPFGGNMRRLLVSSERSLDGKIFVEFVALFLISFLHNKMKRAGLYKTYTQQELLDKLDVIECFEEAGCRLQVGEILEKQKGIYEALEIPAPTSL